MFGIGLTLVVMGRYYDAFVSAGLGLVNTAISTYQEIRAKRQLERISVVSAPAVAVVREGRKRQVPPAELVVGDVVRVGPGDQIAVDGTMVGDGTLGVDESLLTGESDALPKRAGDKPLSGSFCTTGTGHLEAEKVGADEVPFTSARKWSALAFDGPERRGTYALGAIETLEPYLPSWA